MPGTPGGVVVKSKLFHLSGSADLRQLKKGINPLVPGGNKKVIHT